MLGDLIHYNRVHVHILVCKTHTTVNRFIRNIQTELFTEHTAYIGPWSLSARTGPVAPASVITLRYNWAGYKFLPPYRLTCVHHAEVSCYRVIAVYLCPARV